MAAVGVAGGVRVVFEDEDLALDAVVAQAGLSVLDEPLEDPLPRLVLDDELTDRVALRGCILRVGPDIKVEARTVAEEDVARTSPRDDPPEQVARDFIRSAVSMNYVPPQNHEDSTAPDANAGQPRPQPPAKRWVTPTVSQSPVNGITASAPPVTAGPDFATYS